MDSAKLTAQANWSIYCKLKANANMMMHPKIHIKEEEAVKKWMKTGNMRIAGERYRVESFLQTIFGIICDTCCQHGHGEHNCPTPETPRCGICAGEHHSKEHKCKVKMCDITGRRCHRYDTAKCVNCDGDHVVWSLRECTVQQDAIRASQQ
jgi:hypothetical protein